ncbi:MAG: hypothetical protein N4A72_16285 [Bacteroidales bacterium]|jgi:hypothetical protein|nr:hypothetical protein [Bacteroidales bacterium]
MEISKDKLVENGRHCKLMYIEEYKTVYEMWEGFVYGNELKEAWQVALDFYKQQGANKVILDSTYAKVIRAEDTEWYNREIMPLYYNYGLEAVAIIESKSPTGRFSLRSACSVVKGDSVKIEYFDNSSDALEWIKGI